MISPEVKFARKIFKKYNLSIPVDLKKVVKDYAKLEFRSIPIEGVDGVSINLKNIEGKSPVVVVNSNISERRQFFTLAHELGHLVIPWHLGTIIDEIYHQAFKDYLYVTIEGEANRFAAELLMPEEWIIEQYKSSSKDDLSKFHSFIADCTNVSLHAAAIRLIQILPENIIYTAVNNDIVKHSGKTRGTQATPQNSGEYFDKEHIQYSDYHTVLNHGNIQFNWWQLGSNIKLPNEEKRPWREIQKVILESLNIINLDSFKSSLNGVLAGANSMVKRTSNYSIKSIAVACIHRLKNRNDDFEGFMNHPEFKDFIYVRAKDFFDKE